MAKSKKAALKQVREAMEKRGDPEQLIEVVLQHLSPLDVAGIEAVLADLDPSE